MTSMPSPKSPALDFSAVAIWGARGETPDALASRWIKLIERLQALDPILAHWYDWTMGTPLAPFHPENARVAQMIAAGVGTNDDGTPQPRYGYQYNARNSTAPGQGPRNILAHMFAGSPSEFGTNCVSLRTDRDVMPDPDVVTYKIFRGAVLALAECFDAAMASALPDRLIDLWPQDRRWLPTLRLAWISYIAPQFAHLITPPASAIIERRPDGGLLMAATEETFAISNPAHLAAARAIEAAVAPFNALSWPQKA